VVFVIDRSEIDQKAIELGAHKSAVQRDNVVGWFPSSPLNYCLFGVAARSRGGARPSDGAAANRQKYFNGLLVCITATAALAAPLVCSAENTKCPLSEA
jgi:hypothetical protein